MSTSTVFEGLKTIHLFVREDYKTVMLPVAFLSYFATPHTTPSYYARSLLWTFLNLLYFCICNQLFDPAEDMLNKPYRPIPAGRISVDGANRLRWAVLPLCLGISWHWGVLPQCLVMLVLGSWYNQGNLGKHWVGRQGSVAIMYGALNSGAAVVACDTCGDALSTTYFLRHVLNSLMILTTIQAADFRDASGDAERGRLTLPILFPQLSRELMPALLVVWSVIVCIASTLVRTQLQAPLLVQGGFALAGLMTGMRFQLLKKPEQDRASYLWYDIWLCAAQVLTFV
ncbi:hypothetical protein DL93DRAFT_2050956 [Clavulina sp. PMI_390]|nr:hypothetical protein DL93DRAFT_2050956 [Clavulina sp. PMI_390]